jgi:hypothetical protein
MTIRPPASFGDFAEQMPNARLTDYGAVNVQTRVTSRSSGSTYIVSDDPSVTDGKSMTREEFARVASMQDAYIAEQEMVVVDGHIGNVEDFRTRARLSIERGNANIAGMQQKLYYPREGSAEPEVQVIYTPGLSAPGYPGRPMHRRRPGEHGSPGSSGPTTSGVEEGRPADVEQDRLRPRRVGPARRLQGRAR